MLPHRLAGSAYGPAASANGVNDSRAYVQVVHLRVEDAGYRVNNVA